MIHIYYLSFCGWGIWVWLNWVPLVRVSLKAGVTMTIRAVAILIGEDPLPSSFTGLLARDPTWASIWQSHSQRGRVGKQERAGKKSQAFGNLILGRTSLLSYSVHQKWVNKSNLLSRGEVTQGHKHQQVGLTGSHPTTDTFLTLLTKSVAMSTHSEQIIVS